MSKGEKAVVLVVLAILTIVVFAWFKSCTSEPKVSEYEIMTQKIEQLQVKIDSLQQVRDTLIREIDNSKMTIKIIETRYEEKINAIRTQSPSDDYVLFTEYLRRFSPNLEPATEADSANHD